MPGVHDPVAKLVVVLVRVVLLVAMVVLLQLPGQSDAMLRELHKIECCSVSLGSELPSSPAANRYHASMIATIRIV